MTRPSGRTVAPKNTTDAMKRTGARMPHFSSGGPCDDQAVDRDQQLPVATRSQPNSRGAVPGPESEAAHARQIARTPRAENSAKATSADAAPEILRLRMNPVGLRFLVRWLTCAFGHSPSRHPYNYSIPLGSSPKLASCLANRWRNRKKQLWAIRRDPQRP